MNIANEGLAYVMVRSPFFVQREDVNEQNRSPRMGRNAIKI